MKENQMIQTTNVEKILDVLEEGRNRPKHEEPGFIVVYGPKGTGKSRAFHTLAIKNNCIYIRLSAKDTARSFAQKLHHLLEYYDSNKKVPELDTTDVPSHGVSITMVDRCVRYLAKHPDMEIYIDEFDYALEASKHDILDTIRDLIDRTMALFVCVGMDKVLELLEKRSRALFDRMMASRELSPWTEADTIKVAKGISSATMTDSLAREIHMNKNAKGGSARQVIHQVSAYEATYKAAQEHKS